MTRWLVTGAHGMLGTDLVDTLRADGDDVTSAGRRALDITDREAVRAAVADHDVVVSTAAWTDVDGAETREDDAYAINAVGPALLADACAATGARLVQISTDYVFAGDAAEPYAEDAPTGPRTAYGRTKLAGELAVRELLPERSWVLRTAWLYGAHGGSFVRTMARLSGERETLEVVADQRGQPTWTLDVVDRVRWLVAHDAPAGAYHATAGGETTWHGLAQAVFAELGLDPARVRPTTSDAYPRPAPRPAYSVLGHDAWAALGAPAARDWRASLAAAAPTVLR